MGLFLEISYEAFEELEGFLADFTGSGKGAGDKEGLVRPFASQVVTVGDLKEVIVVDPLRLRITPERVSRVTMG